MQRPPFPQQGGYPAGEYGLDHDSCAGPMPPFQQPQRPGFPNAPNPSQQGMPQQMGQPGPRPGFPGQPPSHFPPQQRPIQQGVPQGMRPAASPQPPNMGNPPPPNMNGPQQPIMNTGPQQPGMGGPRPGLPPSTGFPPPVRPGLQQPPRPAPQMMHSSPQMPPQMLNPSPQMMNPSPQMPMGAQRAPTPQMIPPGQPSLRRDSSGSNFDQMMPPRLSGGPNMAPPQMAAPSFGGPIPSSPIHGQAPGFPPSAQPPLVRPPMGAPSFAPQAAAPQFGGNTGSQADLTQQFANMQMGGGQVQAQPQSQVPTVNLLSGPPPAWWPANPKVAATIDPQISVCGSPFSNCDPSYKRCTLNAIPNNLALLNRCKIPFGLLITPYRHLLEGDEPIPVVNPEAIVRCRRCRTYINPWVQFIEQGTRWKCNLCYLANEVPSFFDWEPETQKPIDRMQRPELKHGVIEFVAPQEYMVRPPQPVVMLFLIDVSFAAVNSGMVATAARTILDSLDSIPNDDRTKVSFICFDSNLYFFTFDPDQSEPKMLVVADLEDVYLPTPEDLLVCLSESRESIENFLSRLGDMFKTNQNVGNCLGRALQFSYKLIHPIGGKIVVLQSVLPNAEEGALKAREDQKLLGTPKESTLLQPSSQFYKTFAVDCSRTQVCIDVFLFNGTYTDIATLSGCAKYTGGSVYYYPNFNAGRAEDALKFSNELAHFLGRPIGLEAVLRVRASKGIRMTSYHGNFFLRSTDLLQLPNVSPDNSYAVEMVIEENLTGSVACFQTALLHTSSSGERRIRVLTLALPITGSLADVFSAADPYAITTLLTKKGVDRALTSKLEDAREAILFKLVDILAAFRTSFATSQQASMQLLAPENLRVLPILALGILKSLAFRQSNVIPSDLRSYLLSVFYTSPPESNMVHIHPRFWSLHDMTPEMGLEGEDGRILFPPLLNLSSEKLERHGVYLMDNGFEIFLWVGRAADPNLLMALFGKNTFEGVPNGKITMPILQNDFNAKVNKIIDKIRQLRLQSATVFPHLYIIKEDGDANLRSWFLSYLVEDRFEKNESYPQFLTFIREQIQKS